MPMQPMTNKDLLDLRKWCVEQAAFILKNKEADETDVLAAAEKLYGWATR